MEKKKHNNHPTYRITDPNEPNKERDLERYAVDFGSRPFDQETPLDQETSPASPEDDSDDTEQESK